MKKLTAYLCPQKPFHDELNQRQIFYSARQMGKTAKHERVFELIEEALIKEIKAGSISIKITENQCSDSMGIDFVVEADKTISDLKNQLQAKVLELAKANNRIDALIKGADNDFKDITTLKAQLETEQKCTNLYANQLGMCKLCNGSGVYRRNSIYLKRYDKCPSCNGESLYFNQIDQGEMAKFVQAKRVVDLTKK